MATTVVNINLGQECDVYIGRKRWEYHYGNPFTHKHSSVTQLIVATREEAIENFKKWLLGTDFKDVEQTRRKWILDNIHKLKGKRLGCYCHPKSCHGDVYADILDNYTTKYKKQLLIQNYS